MAEEPNGHANPSRMDRIERAIEGLIDGHERLLASQQQLALSQAIMTHTVKKLLERPPGERP